MSTHLSTREHREETTMATVAEDTRPNLSLVKDQSVEGTVVEHQGEVAQPTWIQSNKALRHAIDNRLYVAWSLRGYRELGRRWLAARRDDYPQMIETARAALQAAKGNMDREEEIRERLDQRVATYKRHKRLMVAKTSGWTTAAAAGATVGAITGGPVVDLLMGLGAMALGVWHGRPEPEAPAEVLDQPAIEGALEPVAAAPTAERAFDAPPPPALTIEELDTALREIGIVKQREQITVHAAPERGKDGNTTAVFDLPARVTVGMLQKQLEAFAGALGRDSSMVDIVKAGTERRVSLWMTDADPFAAPRPSPLLTMRGGVDAWKTGAPVGWNKRGAIVELVINNSSFVIAGMTRSGKGVGAANLAVGAALDVRINLRIVAGKTNGEWDAYAKAGVAATYFKPNPERLLALLKALKADMDRRNKILGELGKSKMTAETINRLGGIEVLIIDEVATFTRSGKPLRDDILDGLIDISAVAAGAGILLVLITQYPEVDVLPQALTMNCGTKWAMRVDNATQSNAILGAGASSSGRDASKFDPPLPGLGWLDNPFAGVTDKARSFDLDEDERNEITTLTGRAAELRKAAGRLVGQWEDPIEQHLLNETGASSAAGGPARDGVPGREVMHLSAEQVQQVEALRGALTAMNDLGRDVAQLDEMAEIIGGGMAADRLGELLRAAGAGGTVKITVPHRTGRVNGYQRAEIADAMNFFNGA
jgi:S-DNA-T family DNA segregation ATPase FtsK/SpoIIIE